MKAIVAVVVLVFVSQAYGYSSGRVVSAVRKETKYCQDCLNFLNDLKQIVSSSNTSAQVEQLMKQMLCSKLGSLEGVCNDFADQYVPLLLKNLASLDDPRQVCGVMGLCTQEMMKFLPKPTARIHKQGSEECDLCKQAVIELKEMIQNPDFQGNITSFFENTVCSFLGSLSSECKADVQKYIGIVFEIMENELDPVAVCQALGLCSQAKMLPLSRIGLTSSATKVKVIRTQKKVQASAECVVCEFVINELDMILGNNRTQEAIEAALEKVCSLLPDTVREECTTLVDQYAVKIIELLVQQLPPAQICTQLGLCQQTVSAPPNLCPLCEFVIKELDSILGSNRSEATVKAALEKVCDLLPDTISGECKSFVILYGQAVIDLLVHEIDPKTICTDIKLCGNKAVQPPVKKMAKKVSASPQCVMCEFVMKEIDTMLSDNATQQEIEAAFFKVCSVLPATVKNECTTFVSTYAPAIIQLLVQELDPSEICTTIGLCAQRSFLKATPLKRLKGAEECQFCVTVLNYVDSLLKESATAQDVEEILEKVCNFLPGNVKAQCDAFVDEYTPLILSLLAGEIDPEYLCKEIKLCNNSTKKAGEQKDNKLYFKGGLLGQDRCTWGPSYWCVNKETATRCGAMEHCRKHVWN